MDTESYVSKYGREHRELITLALKMLEGKRWAGPGFDVDLYLLHVLPRPMIRFRLVGGLMVKPSSVKMHDAHSGTAFVAGAYAVEAVFVDGEEGVLNETSPPSADFVVRPLPPIKPTPREDPMPPPLELTPRPPTESQQLVTLAFYKAQTERLMVLTNFLAQPAKAPQDADGNSDPDVVSAYNLAVETTLKHIRQLILSETPKHV